MTPVNRRIARRSSATVYSQGKARPIIVELCPPGGLIGFRLMRTRRVYHLPIDWCYREAVRAHMAAVKAERKKARAAK